MKLEQDKPLIKSPSNTYIRKFIWLNMRFSADFYYRKCKNCIIKEANIKSWEGYFKICFNEKDFCSRWSLENIEKLNSFREFSPKDHTDLPIWRKTAQIELKKAFKGWQKIGKLVFFWKRKWVMKLENSYVRNIFPSINIHFPFSILELD